MCVIEVVRGDITRQVVDAIVNAANETLLGGGGVDGAIHRAAGSGLVDACRKLGGCITGDAKITPGFSLPAKFVIHAVGPVWRGGRGGEDELLRRCYERAIDLAGKYKIRSIAFPCISTGAYGFPFERAARIAVQTVKTTLRRTESVDKVIFVCFSDPDEKIYRRVLQESANS